MMPEVQENHTYNGPQVRPIDWRSYHVWATSFVIALGLGALGGVGCALADPLLAYRTSGGEELAAAVWSLAATLFAFGAAFWIALRWKAKYGGGDPSTIIVDCGKNTSGGQAPFFLMMLLWILVVLGVGAVVLAVFDLFLEIRSSPGSRVLALSGFGIVGIPLLFWILGEQAQTEKSN